jgi:hypothetical protein
MKRRFDVRISFLLALACSAIPLRAETMTYPELVDHLTNLERLATPPAPGERGDLASSHDRHSRYDEATGQYIAWDANADGDCGSEALQTHDNEGRLVMADIQGPGCIWRTWTATPGPGHVKIYLDGSSTPVIDLPWSAFFDATHAPFTRGNLVYHTGPESSGQKSGGWNNFTPISFAKSCRIVAEKNWGMFYHFNYTRFPAGTVVPTFQNPLPAEDAAALDRASNILGACGRDPAGVRKGQATETSSVTVPPHGSVTVANLTGEGAITALRLRFAPGSIPSAVEEQRKVLREVALRITFDGELAVWSPMGDFFGCGAGAVPHRTLPSGLKEDGTWYSYWYMPFAQAARVQIENDGDRAVALAAEVVHAPLDAPASSLLRFHAKWHRDLPSNPDRPIDWTMLTTEGCGRFVGTQLHIWSPCNGWWGEGDEKFFVDGEKFPSTFGTGSEDYFGYAWGRLDVFSRPFHAQTVNEDCHGHVSDCRWHIADNVPFQTSFEGDIEKYFPDNRPALYAVTTFWYLGPGGRDPFGEVPVDQRVGYWLAPVVYHEPQSIEGEAMPVVGQPAHPPHIEDMSEATKAIANRAGDRNWGANAQLLWPAQAPGEELALGFDIREAGNYHLMAHVTHGPGYGVVEIGIDGGTWSKPIDLYGEKVVPDGYGWNHPIQLAAGRHLLCVRLMGKNAASKGCAFGLDYLKIMPAY